MPDVASHMTRDLLTVSPSAPLRDAAREMHARGVGAVLVLDEGRLIGILTERDMLRAVATEHQPDEPVSEWMTHHPETIE
jgi:CBS domain-containing protein